MRHQCAGGPEDAGLNGIVEKRWMIRTAPSLNYSGMEYVWDDYKLRRKKGIAASN